MKLPAGELAEVMRVYGGGYLQPYGNQIPAFHRTAIDDIIACRTPVMRGSCLSTGGKVEI